MYRQTSFGCEKSGGKPPPPTLRVSSPLSTGGQEDQGREGGETPPLHLSFFCFSCFVQPGFKTAVKAETGFFYGSRSPPSACLFILFCLRRGKRRPGASGLSPLSLSRRSGGLAKKSGCPFPPTIEGKSTPEGGKAVDYGRYRPSISFWGSTRSRQLRRADPMHDRDWRLEIRDSSPPRNPC